ncbi:hypothetical protein SEA_VINCENZO_7 [Mycobacterium phage Vincenzo]|uniref:Uncharacterized protein n=2 Tax=Coopervirus vincenzo TaxID=1983110 RepID=A0A0F6WDY9_9CAUD|nr:hypothetical protein SEA_VINCENZO_7 [Mycobacterium phage Vincenzo]AKF14269.1 hypothetical protein SEA_VINCENZO_7 [Mycobacterium phage Vincenzo]AKF14672.1 hypothetical protein SEA_ALANGRANT_7 [Mycobacterium phage AlanGrant]
MADLAKLAYQQARRSDRVAIKVMRARKFRVEIPVLLSELQADPVAWGQAIWDHLEGFVADRNASDLLDRMRCVFVGGLDAAQAAGQAWFTDYISPGMVLVCFEADPPD